MTDTSLPQMPYDLHHQIIVLLELWNKLPRVARNSDTECFHANIGPQSLERTAEDLSLDIMALYVAYCEVAPRFEYYRTDPTLASQTALTVSFKYAYESTSSQSHETSQVQTLVASSSHELVLRLVATLLVGIASASSEYSSEANLFSMRREDARKQFMLGFRRLLKIRSQDRAKSLFPVTGFVFKETHRGDEVKRTIIVQLEKGTQLSPQDIELFLKMNAHVEVTRSDVPPKSAPPSSDAADKVPCPKGARCFKRDREFYKDNEKGKSPKTISEDWNKLSVVERREIAGNCAADVTANVVSQAITSFRKRVEGFDRKSKQSASLPPTKPNEE